MEKSKDISSLSPVPDKIPPGNEAKNSLQLLEKERADTDTELKDLDSQLDGLDKAAADARLKQVGTNEVAREKHQSAIMRLLGNIKNLLYDFTQTSIIHVIRTNKIPFFESRASSPSILSSLTIVALGVWLTVSPTLDHGPWIRPVAVAVLAFSGHHHAGLCTFDADGENLVRSRIWQMMRVVVLRKGA